MGKFYTGAGTGAYVGNNTASSWGSNAADSSVTQLNFTSETLNGAVTKADEGSLLASKTTSARNLTAVNVSGSLSFILRPENTAAFFTLGLGERTEGADADTYILSPPNKNVFPRSNFYIDRKYAKYKYTDCMVRTLSLECVAGDYVKGSIDLIGCKEEVVEESAWPTQITKLELPSYKCTAATFKWAGQDVSISIKGVNVTFDNGLEETPKTYTSGVYNSEPSLGQRTVTFDVSLSASNFALLKETYAKGEAYAALELTFTSPAEGHSIVISAPNVAITEASGNVSGTGLIDMSLSGVAVSVGDVEPVTVTVNK